MMTVWEDGMEKFESVEKLIKPEAHFLCFTFLLPLLSPIFCVSNSRNIVIFGWKIEFLYTLRHRTNSQGEENKNVETFPFILAELLFLIFKSILKILNFYNFIQM